MKSTKTLQLALFLIVNSHFSILNCVRAQQTSFPIIRNYTPKEYNGNPQVLSVLQDKRGSMYFGVGDGVMEYDGISWKNIPNENKSYVRQYH